MSYHAFGASLEGLGAVSDRRVVATAADVRQLQQALVDAGLAPTGMQVDGIPSSALANALRAAASQLNRSPNEAWWETHASYKSHGRRLGCRHYQPGPVSAPCLVVYQQLQDAIMARAQQVRPPPPGVTPTPRIPTAEEQRAAAEQGQLVPSVPTPEAKPFPWAIVAVGGVVIVGGLAALVLVLRKRKKAAVAANRRRRGSR